MRLANPFARPSSRSTPAALPAPAARPSSAPAFSPTPLQHAFLQAITRGSTPQTALVNLDIARTTWYRWRQDPGFRGHFAAAYVGDLITSGWELLDIARQNASTSFRYWKAVADLTFDPACRQLLAEWANWCGAAASLPNNGLPENDPSAEADASASQAV